MKLLNNLEKQKIIKHMFDEVSEDFGYANWGEPMEIHRVHRALPNQVLKLSLYKIKGTSVWLAHNHIADKIHLLREKKNSGIVFSGHTLSTPGFEEIPIEDIFHANIPKKLQEELVYHLDVL